MLRESILKELEQNMNMPLSGQYLADKYNVSRNAVWKAINVLKEEGYSILTAKNKGYYMPDESDVLSSVGIRKYFVSDKALDIKVYDSIDSTNNEGKRHIITGFHENVLIVANEQEHGRGHYGSDFKSPHSEGIYMTLVYKISPQTIYTADRTKYSNITGFAAEAIIQILGEKLGIKVSSNEKNEILYKDKKVGGILTEAVTDLETGIFDSFAVGIGLHLSTLHDKDERILTRNELIAGIVEVLLGKYDMFFLS